MVCTKQKKKILRNGGKNSQKNYRKKNLNDLDKHNGVISNPESDILECEIRWALGSTMDFPDSSSGKESA